MFKHYSTLLTDTFQIVKVCVSLIVLGSFLFFIPLNAQRNPEFDPDVSGLGSGGTCNIPKKEIKIWNLGTPGVFLPIVPQQCAFDGEAVQPLSLTVLPDVFIRFFGFMISLVFYVTLLAVLIAGLAWIYSGLDGNQAGLVKQILQNSAVGLFMCISIYLVIFTVLNIFGMQSQFTSFNSFF